MAWREANDRLVGTGAGIKINEYIYENGQDRRTDGHRDTMIKTAETYETTNHINRRVIAE